MQLTPYKRENVLPLPVVLISTLSTTGIRNAAPWGNITPILRPLDQIILASWIRRDTLDNIRETGEFVVNVPPVGMLEEVMICSRNYPPEVDEFEEAGLVPRPSSVITPPGIEGSIAWMECRLVEEILREKYALVIGKVERLEVNDQYASSDGDIDIESARPLSMVCGNDGIRYTYPVDAGRFAPYSEMFIKQS
ncbi:flavin reductase family protein [Methanogenium organophilum]|uniref:Flavin reductase family protein n=1 Tax=Methanogenium organophilum TaxID=2199 RepID=A0A9X9S5B3_METOG|nr:flavin reductase family protein [Methanogenium organophilum]WAI01997.1 flavin reductase family protein [Methanogenium organophilum]